MKTIYCCMDCGNVIDRRTALFGQGRCKKCSLEVQKGCGNPMYGRKLNDSHPFKNQKGKNHPLYNKKRHSHSQIMMNKNNPNYKSGKFCKKYCKECNKKITCTSTTGYCQEHFIVHHLMKRRYGRYYYKNIYFKSSWEANFAKWCDLSDVKWEYEPKTFKLDKGFYLPDFYLPEFNCWIEIKGYLSEYANNKLDKIKTTYKSLDLRIYNKNILELMSII